MKKLKNDFKSTKTKLRLKLRQFESDSRDRQIARDVRVGKLDKPAKQVLAAFKKGKTLMRPVKSPRHGWAEAFEKMAKAGDDALLDEGGPATP